MVVLRARQLSRWVRAGKVLQLRRGLYALAEPYRKVEPEPFLVANRLTAPSYVSLQSALSFHGVIPEYVPVVVSVTRDRPSRWDNFVGSFLYRHVKAEMFFGYTRTDLGNGQHGFVARPEKALLDLRRLRLRPTSRRLLHSVPHHPWLPLSLWPADRRAPPGLDSAHRGERHLPAGIRAHAC